MEGLEQCALHWLLEGNCQNIFGDKIYKNLHPLRKGKLDCLYIWNKYKDIIQKGLKCLVYAVVISTSGVHRACQGDA